MSWWTSDLVTWAAFGVSLGSVGISAYARAMARAARARSEVLSLDLMDARFRLASVRMVAEGVRDLATEAGAGEMTGYELGMRALDLAALLDASAEYQDRARHHVSRVGLDLDTREGTVMYERCGDAGCTVCDPRRWDT